MHQARVYSKLLHQAMLRGILVNLDYLQENRLTQFYKLYIGLTILCCPVVRDVMSCHTLQLESRSRFLAAIKHWVL